MIAKPFEMDVLANKVRVLIKNHVAYRQHIAQRQQTPLEIADRTLVVLLRGVQVAGELVQEAIRQAYNRQ